MGEIEPAEQKLRILGQAIRQTREQNSFSVQQLADATGVAAERIAALEDGHLDPHLELLLRLAEGMGVRPIAFVVRAEELSEDAPREDACHE